MTNTDYKSNYNYRWRKARLQFLAENPLCVYCEQSGHTTVATIVDHKIPHKGDPVIFWDVKNWQPMCKLHHDSTKKSEEMSGGIRGCDIHGFPLDPFHHWYREDKS